MSNLNRAIKRGLSHFAAHPPMLLSEWAEKYFYLSAESSYVEQRWTAYPFQTAILDCMGSDEIAELNFMKSARVGYTKMLLAAILYFAEHKRRNQGIWQPTDDDADDFVKTELDAALRDVEVIRNVFPKGSERSKDNTMRQKRFLGSIAHIRGGKAAKNYRRLSLDVAIIDELDGFDTDVEKEGSPPQLAKKRLEGAVFPKQINGSTPKLKLNSMIEAAFKNTERAFYYYVKCPECGEYHRLTFGQLKWEKSDLSNVHHLCQCGYQLTQAKYLQIWKQGRWMDEEGVWIGPGAKFFDSDNNPVPAPRSIGFHIWTAYSPQAEWSGIAADFLHASRLAERGDKSSLKTFVNTTLGESWEEDVEKTDGDMLKNRAEPYALRTIPFGGLVLVAGVDVQDNRFEIVVYAFGVGTEAWVVDYTVLDANPDKEEDWDKLDQYLDSTFQHASGVYLKIEAAAIDTGGHHTHRVYEFCRTRESRKIFAVKGDSKPGMPVKGRQSKQDVNTRTGKVLKNGVKLWMCGTDTAKDLLHGCLQLLRHGPGFIHFSKELPDAFYEQLTAEVRIPTRIAGGEGFRWVKKTSGARNEVLDCTVYAFFAAYAIDLHKFTKSMWEARAELVQPAKDLFAIQPTPAETPAPVIIQSIKPKISLSGGRWK